MRLPGIALAVCGLLAGWPAPGRAAATNGAPLTAPFPYVWAEATHVLPETTSDESGYFSLCEGLDGSVYVGSAKYGANSYLVEFDAGDFGQKVVIDTHKVCGLTNTGYAAQAKIHTRNYVGPSGVIYVGSKQGYRRGTNDLAEYPGGYAMSYDPRTGRAENLGMPYAGQGVIDVVADEARGLLYAVTCEDQHWMIRGPGTNAWRELGPMLTPYATTLVGPDGRAHAITKDFDLATYDPATGRVAVRPIHVGRRRFVRAGALSIPAWNLAADGRTAYLILLDDPTLLAVDLASRGGAVKARDCGRMIEGKHPDSRCALSIGPDGRVWALVRVDNETGFGGGYLHWLVNYDPRTRAMKREGVLAVANPGFFDFSAKKPFTHGYHTLPDGTLTPLHAHMGMVVAHDNTIYATILYPYTLLKIDAYRIAPPPHATNSPAARVLDAILALCDRAETHAAEAARVGTLIADRHLRGGAIGAWWSNGCLGPELYGRAANLVNIGLDRAWKPDRTDAEKANDVALVGMEWAPWNTASRLVGEQAARGAYVVGFGPRASPGLTNLPAACAAFFDTGFGADDRVELDGGLRAGHLNHIANALSGWMVMAETTAALTRQGRMPAMWKSYSFPDGKEWGSRYLGRKQFHDEFAVPPQPEGALARAYLDRIRYLVRRLKLEELDDLQRAAGLIAAEAGRGRKTIVAWAGHMPEGYVGRVDDQAWAEPFQLHLALEGQREQFRKATPAGALVLRLGYHGLEPEGPPLFREKKDRLICMAGENPDPAWRMPADALVAVDLMWPFGDGCVSVEGYPFPLFASSGIMQAAAYSAICAEVAARLGPVRAGPASERAR